MTRVSDAMMIFNIVIVEDKILCSLRCKLALLRGTSCLCQVDCPEDAENNCDPTKANCDPKEGTANNKLTVYSRSIRR